MNITHCHLKALSVDLLATIVVSCTKKKKNKKTKNNNNKQITHTCSVFPNVNGYDRGSCFA